MPSNLRGKRHGTFYEDRKILLIAVLTLNVGYFCFYGVGTYLVPTPVKVKNYMF